MVDSSKRYFIEKGDVLKNTHRFLVEKREVMGNISQKA